MDTSLSIGRATGWVGGDDAGMRVLMTKVQQCRRPPLPTRPRYGTDRTSEKDARHRRLGRHSPGPSRGQSVSQSRSQQVSTPNLRTNERPPAFLNPSSALFTHRASRLFSPGQHHLRHFDTSQSRSPIPSARRPQTRAAGSNRACAEYLVPLATVTPTSACFLPRYCTVPRSATRHVGCVAPACPVPDKQARSLGSALGKCSSSRQA